MKTMRTMFLAGTLAVATALGVALTYVVHDMDNVAYAQLYAGRDGTCSTEPGLAFSQELGTGFARTASATIASCLNTLQGLTMTGVASAVNYVNITNSAAGNALRIIATGTDTDVSIQLEPKGAGTFRIGSAGTVYGVLGTSIVNRVSAGTVALASGKAAVSHGLTTAVACSVNMVSSGAPLMADASAFNYQVGVSPGTLNIFGWKPTSSSVTTLTPATASGSIVGWTCMGV